MYFYKNGKKVRSTEENYNGQLREIYNNSSAKNDKNNMLTIGFVIVGIIIAVWLIYLFSRN